MRPLHQQVVVITGASSGLGRCTALELAHRGARVVAFARGADGLASLVREIERRGGQAHAVVGDVSKEADVDRLGDEAVARFGRIDTWINNAAVFIQGRVEDIEPTEFRRVVDVNLIGSILGSRRALLQMKEQGEGGIIQISSIVGERGPSFFSPYAASKRGLDGFTESLRSELWGTEIRVSTLYLPALDTPIYQHARGKLGTQPRPAPPVSPPEDAAEAIADLAERPGAKKYLGWFRHAYTLPDRLAPRLGDWFLHRTAGFTVSDVPAGPDNLDHPATVLSEAIHGGWGQEGWRGFTLKGIARELPVLSGAAAGVTALLLVGLLRR